MQAGTGNKDLSNDDLMSRYLKIYWRDPSF